MASTVTVGDKITVGQRGLGRVLVSTVLTVEPACEDKTNGHWFCATHRKHLGNNFDKDSHVGPRCRMAWWCNEHGPEQP